MRAVSSRRLFTPVLVALIALAWLVLWSWGQSPYGRFLSHQELGELRLGVGAIPLALAFVAGWTLMTVAMMLPTSLPLVILFRTITSDRRDHLRLVALLIAGYLGVWGIFGVAVHGADWGVHQSVERVAWLDAHAWVIGAGTLALAGAYQFTALKYHCLSQCRSPLSFIMEHWHGENERTEAFRLGVHHGLFCLGCCWSLMLVMFAVGVGNLGWMLVVGSVMAVEKNMPWGRRLSAPLGVGLLAWAGVLAVVALV